MANKNMEFYGSEEPIDSEISDVMEDEIARSPKAPSELEERLQENHAASPADSGGDIDADWEEVNTSGAETVFGHNPTPDQSDVEENAHAMGINFEDNEPLDFVKKVDKRDKDRFELNEDSRSGEGSI